MGEARLGGDTELLLSSAPQTAESLLVLEGHMLKPVLCTLALIAFALQGCTSTVSYAVIAPRDAASDDQGCFRQCRLIHAGETKQYLACVRNCPRVRVVSDKQCNEVEIDRGVDQCIDAHAQKFDPTIGIIFIALGVGAMIAIAATAPQSMTSAR